MLYRLQKDSKVYYNHIIIKPFKLYYINNKKDLIMIHLKVY